VAGLKGRKTKGGRINILAVEGENNLKERNRRITPGEIGRSKYGRYNEFLTPKGGARVKLSRRVGKEERKGEALQQKEKERKWRMRG